MKPQLLTGDPHQTNASFTRFMLPFGYQLERLTSSVSLSPRYEDADSKDWLCSAMPRTGECDSALVERARYLMPETRRVLFQRARWLALRKLGQVAWAHAPTTQSDDGMVVDVPRAEGTTFQVILRNPALILLEWEGELRRLHEGFKPASSMACGFLVIECFFPVEQTVGLSDLLEFNELMRYWQRPYEGHWTKGDGMFGKVLASLPVPRVGASPDPLPGSPDHYRERWARWLEFPVHVPCRGDHVRLMPQAWLDQERGVSGVTCGDAEPKPTWTIHPDSRAQVWTCAVHWDGKPASEGKDDPEGSDVLLGRTLELAQNLPMAPPDTAPWLRLLNVDQPGDVLRDEINSFEAAWLPTHTYTRWAQSGTLYGFTPHSAAMLTVPRSEPPAWQHFRTIYFDQGLMMLYVRACLFRFSERLSSLTCRAARVPASFPISPENINAFRVLRWEFAQFTSLYQFPLISNQQQAIEMYAELRRHMDIKDFYEHVRQEIETTQNFLATELAANQTEVTMLLTVVASVGLLLSLVVSLWGADSIMDHLKVQDSNSWVQLFCVAFVGLAGFIGFSLLLGCSAYFSGRRGVQDFLRNLARPRSCHHE